MNATRNSLLAVCLALLALPAAARAAQSNEIAITAAQKEAIGIKSAAVQPAKGVPGPRLAAQIVLPPNQVQVVSSPLGGLIKRLRVAVGSPVDYGTALVDIESPELVTLQREYLQAQTQQQLTRSQLDRDEALYKDGIIAQRRYLETQSTYKEAEAARDEHRQTLLLTGMTERAIAQLEKTRQLSSTLTVVSRTDGVVSELLASSGERVQASAPLLRIADLDLLWVEIRAPLAEVQGLAKGATIALPGYSVSARLLLVGQDVDPQSQTVLVRGIITQRGTGLRPGQFVQAQIISTARNHCFRVPTGAVVRSGEQILVFVETPQGFRAKPVLLLSQQDGYSVVEGLTGNDRVAVSGLATLKAAWQGLGGGE